MKTLLTVAAVAALLSTPVLAGDLTAGFLGGDTRSNATGVAEYQLQYTDSAKGLNYTIEADTRQSQDHGAVESFLALKTPLPAVTAQGFNVRTYAEYGQQYKTGETADFWGYGGSVSHQVYEAVSVGGVEVGPFVGVVTASHREGFKQATLSETRVGGAIAARVPGDNVVSVGLYRTTGDLNSDTVGVHVRHSF